MRRKGRVVAIVTETAAGGHGKGGGRKVKLVTYKKLPGRGSTNPRDRAKNKNRNGED
jgi:hypothetical protein